MDFKTNTAPFSTGKIFKALGVVAVIPFIIGLVIGFLVGGHKGYLDATRDFHDQAMEEAMACRTWKATSPEYGADCTRVERLAGLKPLSELCQEFTKYDAELRRQGDPGIPEVVDSCRKRKI